MSGFYLYLAQRISALIMAPLVILHLAVMIYAVQNGLNADEILGRTRGSLFWGAIYGTFVLAVSIHAAIGIRVILHEWKLLSGSLLNIISIAIMAVLLSLGWRAVYAVVSL
jgi:fumarate reductase subunit C